MSRLTDLISQVAKTDDALAKDLRREVDVLSSRRQFGLNFERHVPESVQLPSRKIRQGDKVVLRSGEASAESWLVVGFEGKAQHRKARLVKRGDAESAEISVLVADLVVVAEFRDAIYPGLRSTGVIERGADKPYHAIINGENFHVLEALTFVCRGQVDCIYIDPPYNTGARDWKYNNDYVDSEDAYRHSKWLAFMERRLLVAKELLNPASSVLIVTIDEKEIHRLGLLIEQIFPQATNQMVSVAINPAPPSRAGLFGRADEYYFFVFLGTAGVEATALGEDWVPLKGRTHRGEIRWDLLRKSGASPTRDGHPDTFYPFFITDDGQRVHSIGDPIGVGASRRDTKPPPGTFAAWPIRQDGSEGRWRLQPSTAREVMAQGGIRLGAVKGETTPIYYLSEGEREKIQTGIYDVTGHREDGSAITSVLSSGERQIVPSTQWRVASHDSTQYGSRLLAKLLPGRKFPFPKSLYAVEDALRFAVGSKPDALVLDFFAGSGTTAHAVMRLNRQDGGTRGSIIVTNNEVGVLEQEALRKKQLRPGDEAWEALGICEHITKPRIASAITGQTPEGHEIQGDYKFGEEFAMAEGFAENAEFFDLTYEDPERVRHGLGFEVVAPLLWMRAGRRGSKISTTAKPFGIAETYAILFDLDAAAGYVTAVRASASLRIAYIVTDDETQFQVVAAQLPHTIVPVRLYAAYLDNFRIQAGA
jgi:adenine-specific DNA-methyltransferase